MSGTGLYGGFEGTETSLEERAGLFEQTVLSGDLANNDGPGFEGYEENSYHVVTSPPWVTNPPPAISLDGFTVRGGNADGVAEEEQDRGGGMYGIYSPKIFNCIFRDNRAGRGGGLYQVGGRLENCTIRNNLAEFGGGIYNDTPEARILAKASEVLRPRRRLG